MVELNVRFVVERGKKMVRSVKNVVEMVPIYVGIVKDLV
jgi:hypothetical protein